jgi:hypothetical protein
MKAETKPQAPPCFAHRHMTGNEYALYDVARSKSHQSDNRILFFDGREMAAEFATMSKSTAYNTAHSLEEKGWFKLIKASTRRRTDGTWSATHYKVLSHQEWEKEHPDGCPAKRNLKKSPVQSEGTVNAQPVQNEAQPVQPEGHNLSINLSNNLSCSTHTNKGTPVQILDTLTPFPSLGRDRDAPANIRSAPEPVQMKVTAMVQAVRLATTITREFQNHGESYEQGWRDAVQHLLNQGHAPGDILKMVELMKEHFSAATTEQEGGAGFISFLKQKQYDTPRGFPVFLTWLEAESSKKEGGIQQ